MKKEYNWKEGITAFLIGYVLFFWMTTPSVLGMWAGICLAYVLCTGREVRVSPPSRAYKVLDNVSSEEMKYYSTNVWGNFPAYNKDDGLGITTHDILTALSDRDKRAIDYYWNSPDRLEHIEKIINFKMFDERYNKLHDERMIKNNLSKEEKKIFLNYDMRDDEWIPVSLIFGKVAEKVVGSDECMTYHSTHGYPKGVDCGDKESYFFDYMNFLKNGDTLFGKW